jgi:AcrR family transcriptional regulator
MANPLTRESILDAAEQVLRRFGPSKATVVDVARALGVSHGSVYKHFSSKAELRDAVVERWLKRTSDPLETIVTNDEPPRERLRHWVEALMTSKRSKVTADPELFATARELFAEASGVVDRHIENLSGQIARILADGVEAGVFDIADIEGTARAVLDATARFHDPAHAAEWVDPRSGEAFARVWTLIITAIASNRER